MREIIVLSTIQRRLQVGSRRGQFSDGTIDFLLDSSLEVLAPWQIEAEGQYYLTNISPITLKCWLRAGQICQVVFQVVVGHTNHAAQSVDGLALTQVMNDDRDDARGCV